MLRAYFGHHKCASSWAGVIVAEIARELGMRHTIVYELDGSSERLVDQVTRNRVEFLTYANADVDQVKQLGPLRGFHIVRDPRDVIVSAYFSHLHSHPTAEWPELIEHRRTLEKLSKEDGLMLEMKFRERQMHEMATWDYTREDVLELKMEHAVAQPYSCMLEVAQFLELLDPGDLDASRRLQWIFWKLVRRLETQFGVNVPLRPRSMPAERVLGIVWEHQFAKKAGGRKPGQEDSKSHYRKGVAGDWRNHFTPAHTKFFKERYGHLVLLLGYETNADWS